MSKIHLIIGDSHAHPDHPNRRYTKLGKLINDIKPDVVVDIGDWFDMPSLCSYDKGKSGFEGRRYWKDIAAGVEGQDRLLTEVRKQKRKLPRFVRCIGNHEDRITRAIDCDAAVLEGTIGLSDLQSAEYKWEEYPFLQGVEIDGVIYQHYFTSGNFGRPIGGDNQARLMLTKHYASCTAGHSHLLDHAMRVTAGGSFIHGLSVGCYFDYDSAWAGPSAKSWWNGIVICRDVYKGHYDMEYISYDRIVREYK